MKLHILYPTDPQTKRIWFLLVDTICENGHYVPVYNFGIVIDVACWEDFLHHLWHSYAVASKTCEGQALSLPLRVRLLDYKAETRVFYDAACGGIRYKSLTRYDEK